MSYQIHFQEPVHVHFIGIGGISMSGLAEVLLRKAFTVSGSDAKGSLLTERLEEEGAVIQIGQCAANITDDIDVVVYTAAIHPDNPEFAAAVEKKIPMLSRAELLGQLMRNYETAVAIAGTHGKTTTTSMISEIAIAAGADPTISVGGILPTIGGNIRIGQSQTFITEACEYTNSFLDFFPTKEIILNIREDHLDFFKDLYDIRHSFRRFEELLPEDGLLVINGDIENLDEMTKDLKARVVTFGMGEGEYDYRAENVVYDDHACASFDVIKKGEPWGRISLRVPGEHNVTNALSAVALAEDMGFTKEEIAKGLAHFTGVDRRFQKKGMMGGVSVYDDYAHHPDEIEATLTMARKIPKRKLWCAFQPHTYSRTKALLPEFADALSLADEVVLTAIYPARETDTLGVSSDDIVKLLKDKGVSAYYCPTFEEAEDFLRENCREGDLLITMGAGDIVKVGEKLVEA